jgi:hypothetical protein
MTWKRSGHPQSVTEYQADPGTAEVYNDIKSLLGLPQVPLLFQIYAGYRGFLMQFWQAAKPVIASSAFSDSARRLSADAYTRMHNYFEIADARSSVDGSLPELAELALAVESFQQQDGAMLLLLSFITEAFDNPVGKSREAGAAAAPFVLLLPTLPEAEGGPQTASVLPLPSSRFWPTGPVFCEHIGRTGRRLPSLRCCLPASTSSSCTPLSRHIACLARSSSPTATCATTA